MAISSIPITPSNPDCYPMCTRNEACMVAKNFFDRLNFVDEDDTLLVELQELSRAAGQNVKCPNHLEAQKYMDTVIAEVVSEIEA